MHRHRSPLAALLLLACGAPRPAAYAEDFARRHHCPVDRVNHVDEGPDRVVVMGCGEREVYTRSCRSRSGAAAPQREPERPLSEVEARDPGGAPEPEGVGCAWSREGAASDRPPPSASAP